MRNLALAAVVALCVLSLRAGAGEEKPSALKAPKSGEFWYRLGGGPGGKAQGFARILLTSPEAGGFRAQWELRLAFPGGTYEEERTMALGADHRLLAASYSTPERMLGEGRREAERWVGRAFLDSKETAIDRDAPPDAVSGLFFLLAAMIPFEEGAAFTRTDLNEAKGFETSGEAVYAYHGEEALEIDGESLASHRVDVTRSSGTLKVWVGADRSVLKIDWGGGNVMVWSAKSTKHLFEPPPPPVTEVETGQDKLVLTGDFPAFTPGEMFDHFTRPDLLTKWWPQQAVVEAKPGGKFHLRWPQAGWSLRGEVKACEPGKRFSFTWKWDHQKEAPALLVEVAFEPLEEGGTRLTLTHGPYSPDEAGTAARKDHLKGWLYTFGRLQALR